jgi:hypothetical protein
MRRFPLVLTAGIVALLGAAGPAHAVPTGQRCSAKAIGQIGTRAAAKLQCHAKATWTGGSADPACLARAESRSNAAAAGGCMAADEQATLAATADAFVADVVSMLTPDLTPDTRPCAAMKLGATAKAAKGKLKCHAKAVRRPIVTDSACLATEGQKLQTRWGKAEASGPCATTGDGTAIETKVDGFAADVLRALTPSLSALHATYDVTFTFDPYAFVSGSTALGTIGEGADGDLVLGIQFDSLNYLSVSGPIQAGGGVALDGYFTQGGDVDHYAVGYATASDDGGEQRVAGTVDISGFAGSETLTFTMVRPASGTPPVFSGAYTFAFPESPSGCGCGSTASIELDVPPDGMGASMQASDIDTNGAQLGMFAAGECLVSPRGQVRCRTAYEAVDPSSPAADCRDRLGRPCPIALSGALVADPGGVAGSGDFRLGSAPLFFGSGDWTATK